MDRTLKILLDKYNKLHPEQQIDLSLNAFIYVVIRLHDSVRSDTNFRGGYNEMTRVIRRHLFNRLNIGLLYKDTDTDDTEDNDR